MNWAFLILNSVLWALDSSCCHIDGFVVPCYITLELPFFVLFHWYPLQLVSMEAWLGWWVYHSEFLIVSNRSRHWLKPNKEFIGRKWSSPLGHWESWTNKMEQRTARQQETCMSCSSKSDLNHPWASFPSGSVLCYHCSSCLSLNRHYGHHRNTSQLLCSMWTNWLGLWQNQCYKTSG